MKRLNIVLALLIGLGVSSASAGAQMYDPGFLIIDSGAMLNRISWNHLDQHIQRVSGTDAPSVSARATTPTSRQAASSSLSYKPSIQRRRENLASFVAKSRGVDPEGAGKMEQLFAQTDVIAALGRDLAPYGLRTDDVADAYAAWWMSAWQAAHRDTSDPSRATARAVRAQAADALVASPEFNKATDAMKQEFAEALLVQAALISAMQAEYGANAGMANRMAVSVKQGARSSGVDLDAMTLTEGGFVPAKKTGAADPAPDVEPQALAATNGSGSRTSYGFLAAVGGAGFGAAFIVGRMAGRRG